MTLLPAFAAPTAHPHGNRHALAAMLLGLLLSVLPPLAIAADSTRQDAETEPRWFQIELVIFTQPNAELTAEYWNEQLQPQYDAEAIVLRKPWQQLTAQERIARRLIDSRTAPESADPKSPETTAVAAVDDAQPAMPPALTVPGEADLTAAALPPLQFSTLAALQPRQLPEEHGSNYAQGGYQLLTPEQLQSEPPSEPGQQASEPLPPIDIKRLERQGHRVMFHGSWRQPVIERDNSPSVVIRGGDALDARQFELEGDIKLSLNRYLHLWPHLYFTQPLPQAWQPRHPDSIEALQQAQRPSAEAPLAAEQFSSSLLTPDNAQGETAPIKPALVATEPDPLDADSLLEQQPLNAPARYLTVQLDQPRKMRSKKLHYLDHPLFGLLIRLTPYSLPIDAQQDRPPSATASSSTASDARASVTAEATETVSRTASKPSQQ